MLASSVDRILRTLDVGARVVDVGGWAKPFRRADAVVDLMPYESRGMLGFDGDGPERFSADDWYRFDICRREPWPFRDKDFDFAICSHVLEDVRDPVWVCSELVRIAKAGYLETPSRLEEQSYGIQGPWVGWGHHHWLVETSADGIDFTFKHHVMHGRPSDHFPVEFGSRLTDEERVNVFFWEEDFAFRERTFPDAAGLDAYLASFVEREMQARGMARSSPSTRWATLRRQIAGRVRAVIGAPVNQAGRS